MPPGGVVLTFSTCLKDGAPHRSGRGHSPLLTVLESPGAPAGRSRVLSTHPTSCLGSGPCQGSCLCPLFPSGSNPANWFLSAFLLLSAALGPDTTSLQGAVVKTLFVAEQCAWILKMAWARGDAGAFGERDSLVNATPWARSLNPTLCWSCSEVPI